MDLIWTQMEPKWHWRGGEDGGVELIDDHSNSPSSPIQFAVQTIELINLTLSSHYQIIMTRFVKVINCFYRGDGGIGFVVLGREIRSKIPSQNLQNTHQPPTNQTPPRPIQKTPLRSIPIPHLVPIPFTLHSKSTSPRDIHEWG